MIKALVFVRYNRFYINRFENFFKKSFDLIEEIWADVDGEKINECFEFSSYQEGVRRIDKRLTSMSTSHQTSMLETGQPITIMFLNDTALSSHVQLLTEFILKKLPVLSRGSIDRVVYGIRASFPESRGAVNNSGIFFSTWAFAVIASPKELAYGNVFDGGLNRARFSIIWKTLPHEYTQKVDEWLEPKKILKGWYKAIPGVPLDCGVRERKRFSIYLEHSLLMRFQRLGFACIGLEDAFPAEDRVIFATLIFFDRVFVNLIKVWNRFVVASFKSKRQLR